jgi:hypothetical protein
MPRNQAFAAATAARENLSEKGTSNLMEEIDI